ncbi:Oligopeptide transport ATP-binding protein OppF [Roseivivax jejudonensis]|uniref:Oligopeptide transport ATP-binding protein OppF n=1 Tax=Roseivivax jejudonensis TaxID=1529041 RepID=A0A1X6ZVU5_9RHOB|nr:ATP-binding cassette domain-containing protein [Roseivivax jejudonensis]SLN63322.1 Oligopeptide transport ATP-binding protein OppF [Roseivivax jejudonensis]
MAEPLIEARDLRLALPDLNARPLFGAAPRVEILKGLSFDVARGRVLGIVGESGSGKSTLGRCLVRLLEPTGGTLRFDGDDITHADTRALKRHRRDLQMIFQDPMSSLNPRHSVLRLVEAPMRLYGVANAEDRAREVLERVQLGGAFARRYPHQLSGGQRQRVGIARALALSPRFILADEIVSGLDVSTQAQIIRLLERLVDEMDLTLAFISHDLSVIRRLCHEVIVLRAGEIVEAGPTAEVFAAPKHPYTAELKAAIPLPDPDAGWLSQP